MKSKAKKRGHSLNEIKRRSFLFATIACILVPKGLRASDNNYTNLVLKNGWILNKKDI
jgi:hypothetical protein